MFCREQYEARKGLTRMNLLGRTFCLARVLRVGCRMRELLRLGETERVLEGAWE